MEVINKEVVNEMKRHIELRLRDAKLCYEISKRDIHLGEIISLTCILRYINATIYGIIASEFYNNNKEEQNNDNK